MKTREEKLQQAKRLSSILVNEKDSITHARTDRYYFVIGIFQKLRKEIFENELVRVSNIKRDSTVNYFREKTAFKEANVTSTTYERSQRILLKQIDNRFKNR